jgi:hypothetical protein
MKENMAELRKVLDIFDKAELTVTYILANYYSHSFSIAFKSNALTEIEDLRHEFARTSDIVNLIEKSGYRVSTYRTGLGIVSDYLGTIYIEIDPIDEKD